MKPVPMSPRKVVMHVFRGVITMGNLFDHTDVTGDFLANVTSQCPDCTF